MLLDQAESLRQVTRKTGRAGENRGLRRFRGGLGDGKEVVLRFRVADHDLDVRSGGDLGGKVAAQRGVDLFVEHLHTTTGAELANGEFGSCASRLRRLATGIRIEGDGPALHTQNRANRDGSPTP